MKISVLLSLISFAFAVSAVAGEVPAGMVSVEGGDYVPLYAKGAKPRAVPPFFMSVTQVTNKAFLEFVRTNPKWRRSQVKAVQADANYLRHWAGDLELGTAVADAPVTHVSWHAARAFCEAGGVRLPNQDEWEFVARADATRLNATSDPAYLRLLLEWYSKPASSQPPSVEQAAPNVHGLRGFHGQVWEWVHDFNSTMLVGDSRGDGSLERDLFCGAGSLLAADVSNYAAYMRYAFRSSLRGNYCVGSLGFRTARAVKEAVASPMVAYDTIYDMPGTWRDQEGRPVVLGDLRGKVRVLTLGFTRCKFACPRTLGDMQRIETELGEAGKDVAFVFLSIDPDNDLPERMKQAMTERGMDPARWTFLTAPEPVVRDVAVALNFQYQWVEGFLAHSNLIAVMNEQGNVVHRDEALGGDLAGSISAALALVGED